MCLQYLKGRKGLEESHRFPFDVIETCRTSANGADGGGGGGPGGQQEIGGGGSGGDGGAAEEMDRDGADDGGGGPLPKPDGYAQMTKTQQRNWRVKQAKKAKWLQTKP